MPWIAQNNRPAIYNPLYLSVKSYETLHDDDMITHDDQVLAVEAQDASQLARVNSGQIREWLLSSYDEGSTSNIMARGVIHLYARSHAQFVVGCILDDSGTVPEDCIFLNESQRLNCEVTVGPEMFPWSLYDVKETMDLAWIMFEVRPLFCHGEQDIVKIDREILRRELRYKLLELIATLHERYIIKVNGRNYFFRVTDLDSYHGYDDDTEHPSGEQDSAATISDTIIHDVYRGIIMPRTKLYIQESWFKGTFDLSGVEPPRIVKQLTNVLDVYCNDGEWFPVKKKLLEPCLPLAKYVLSDSSER